MVQASVNPNYPTWPLDGRDGGVPDPTTQGPPWLQIGNESGFLAQLAVWPQQPIAYERIRQNLPFAGVTMRTLYLMGAMRADVVVDFKVSAMQTATCSSCTTTLRPQCRFSRRSMTTTPIVLICHQ